MLSKKYWLLANFLGWTIGVMLIIALSGILDQFGLEGYQFYVGLGMGFAVATTHALFLDRDFQGKIFFVLRGSIGMITPFLIADLFFPYAHGLKLLVCVIIGSFYFSLFTYPKNHETPIFSHHLLTYSLAWILASTPIFFIGLTMQIQSDNLGKFFIAILNLILILSGGVIMGFATKKMVS